MILNCLQTVLKTYSWWKGVGKQLCSGKQSAFVFLLRLVSKSLHSVLYIFDKLCSTGLEAKDICYLGRTFIMKIQIQNTNLSHFIASYLASGVISRHHWILVHKIIGRPLQNIQPYVNSQVFSKYCTKITKPIVVSAASECQLDHDTIHLYSSGEDREQAYVWALPATHTLTTSTTPPSLCPPAVTPPYTASP